MSYFNSVGMVDYKFGTSSEFTEHQNISQYTDIVDRVKSNSIYYRKYTILDGDRPDTLSFKLYGSTKYYWMFFLLNDTIREQGWPLTNQELLELVKADKPNTTVTTKDDLNGIFKVGSTVVGTLTNSTGEILYRNLDIGKLTISGTDTFLVGEIIQTTEDDVVRSVNVDGQATEYNSIHHYENDENDYVDIDPYSDPGVLLTPITEHDRYTASNDNAKEIIVLRKDVIDSIYIEFQELMRK